MNNLENQEVLTALIARIKNARFTAESFKLSGYFESAEMWETVAGTLEGVLYDSNLGSVVSQIKNGEI